jgi:hypothetical protein
MALDAVLDGSTADGIDVQQVIDVLSGSRSHPVQLVLTGDTTNYALQVRSTDTITGKALRVLDSAGVASVVVDDYSMFLPNGMKFGIGTQAAAVAANTLAGFYHTGAHELQTSFDFIYQNTWPGTGSPDVSDVRIFSQQVSGDTYHRALEVHMLANAGTSTWPKIGIELTCQASYVGNNLDRTAGIVIRNLGTVWAIPTPQRLDTGLLIGGDQQGFVNGILYQDTVGAGSTTLFKVSQTGAVTSAAITPRSTDAYALGDSANRWTAVYANVHVASGLGTAAAPAFTWAAEGDTGFYQNGAANAFAVSNGGVVSMSFTANGRINLERAQNVANGGGAAATNATIGGSGPAVAAAAGWLKIFEVGGTPVFIEYWV